MKLKHIANAAGVVFALSLSVASAQEINCEKIGADVQTAAQNAPEQVLVLVEDAIIANEVCACEIVKGAILGSKADKRLVREIVFTAVSAAQGMAATIAECAIAVAPDSAEEIKLALEDALVGSQGKAPAYAGGKAPYYNDKSGVAGDNQYANNNGGNGKDQAPGAGDPSRGSGFGGAIGSGGFYLTPYNASGSSSSGEAPVVEINGNGNGGGGETRTIIREVQVAAPQPQIITVPGPTVFIRETVESGITTSTAGIGGQ